MSQASLFAVPLRLGQAFHVRLSHKGCIELPWCCWRITRPYFINHPNCCNVFYPSIPEFPIFPCRFPQLSRSASGSRAAQKSGQVEVHRGLLGLAPCRILPGDLLEPTGDLLEPTAPIEIWCKFTLKTKKMPKMPRIQLLEYKELYRFNSWVSTGGVPLFPTWGTGINNLDSYPLEMILNRRPGKTDILFSKLLGKQLSLWEMLLF